MVVVSGPFDDLRSRHIRFLDEAAKRGPLTVLLWSDDLIINTTGTAPKFPLDEREYVIDAIRYVSDIVIADASLNPDTLSPSLSGTTWVMEESQLNKTRRDFANSSSTKVLTISEDLLKRFPPIPPCPIDPESTRKKVVVTGCFDWLHSGHVRFFEEVSEYGDLYVVAGHDENIRLLKGEGHPLFPAIERSYMIGAFKFVTAAVISSGHGWLDGEPEFRKISPDIYAVNEDGDKPEKRKFCEENGIEYLVLRRLPKEGLQRRESTKLRGF